MQVDFSPELLRSTFETVSLDDVVASFPDAKKHNAKPFSKTFVAAELVNLCDEPDANDDIPPSKHYGVSITFIGDNAVKMCNNLKGLVDRAVGIGSILNDAVNTSKQTRVSSNGETISSACAVVQIEAMRAEIRIATLSSTLMNNALDPSTDQMPAVEYVLKQILSLVRGRVYFMKHLSTHEAPVGNTDDEDGFVSYLRAVLFHNFDVAAIGHQPTGGDGGDGGDGDDDDSGDDDDDDDGEQAQDDAYDDEAYRRNTRKSGKDKTLQQLLTDRRKKNAKNAKKAQKASKRPVK